MRPQKQFIFLSGLPRSGSTLLTAILAQNPLIYSEGNSALAQYMWDAHSVSNSSASEMLRANRRSETTPYDIVSELPYLYYKNTDCPIVIDKCRGWTSPDNLMLIRKYITTEPKFIILTRSITEIVQSIAMLRLRNGLAETNYEELLSVHANFIWRPFEALQHARCLGGPEFLFVDYSEIVSDTQATLEKIYNFCGWAAFTHDLDNITNDNQEDDSAYGLLGMHDVRRTVQIDQNRVVLPPGIEAQCEELNLRVYAA